MVSRLAVNQLFRVRVQDVEFEGCRLRNRGHRADESGNTSGSLVGVHLLVPWCNGSTRHSECFGVGSNPMGTVIGMVKNGDLPEGYGLDSRLFHFITLCYIVICYELYPLG